ncbi:MAG: hypothetical protein IPJ01_12485 [Micavibrio sp.]|nr:hypothetical protein [Micavibrio sp.]
MNWNLDHDDMDNDVWTALGPFEDVTAWWRLEQRLFANEIWWYARHSPELGGACNGARWKTIEEAKAACFGAHAAILRDMS